MSTKKGGSKGNSIPEKSTIVEDDRTRQEEIADFLRKYKNFADVPVKDLRHIISLFLMEVYSSIYGQYSRKVRGLWANRPENWPVHVPFVDPNNKMKGNGENKHCKPKKDTCVQMLNFLNAEYQAKRGIAVSPYVYSKPDPLLSTSQSWHNDSLQCMYDTSDDSFQLQTYETFYADPRSGATTTSNELDAAVSSIDESMNSYGISESGNDHKFDIDLAVDDSTGGMFSQLRENCVSSSVAMECVTANDEAVYVMNGKQYVAADYEKNFVDLSKFDNGNPFVDAVALRDIALQGIVVNDSNCIATNQSGIAGPQQVMENELASENRNPENKNMNKTMGMMDVKQGEKNVEAKKFGAKINVNLPVQQVKDCEDLFEWDPLMDSAKRILQKLIFLTNRRLVENSVLELLNKACLLFRGEIDEMNPSADFNEKERLVGRAHTLEGCMDITLHLNSLPSEYEDKLKKFINTNDEEVVMQFKVISMDGLKEETKRASQEDVKLPDHESVTVRDTSCLNIKCRPAAVASQSLSFPDIVFRLPITDKVPITVESDSKDPKDGQTEMFPWNDDSSNLMPDIWKDTEFLDSIIGYGSYPIESEDKLKEDDLKKETASFVAEGIHDSSEKIVGSTGSHQKCLSNQHSFRAKLEEAYSLVHQESHPVDSSSVLYSTLNENGLQSQFHENSHIAQAQTGVLFNQQQSYHHSNVTPMVRSEQCTDQSANNSCVMSPGPDIVKSLAEVSLHSKDSTSINVQSMWQSEGCRPVVNESTEMTSTPFISRGGTQRSVSDLENRSIMRGILKEEPRRSSFPGKRKLPEEIEDVCAKPPAASKPISYAMSSPIPICVASANLDDPHFSSHYRKKVKTLNK